jgi:hypothetical protein
MEWIRAMNGKPLSTGGTRDSSTVKYYAQSIEHFIIFLRYNECPLSYGMSEESWASLTEIAVGKFKHEIKVKYIQGGPKKHINFLE